MSVVKERWKEFKDSPIRKQALEDWEQELLDNVEWFAPEYLEKNRNKKEFKDWIANQLKTGAQVYLGWKKALKEKLKREGKDPEDPQWSIWILGECDQGVSQYFLELPPEMTQDQVF